MEYNFDIVVAGCNTSCRHCYVDVGPAQGNRDLRHRAAVGVDQYSHDKPHAFLVFEVSIPALFWNIHDSE